MGHTNEQLDNGVEPCTSELPNELYNQALKEVVEEHFGGSYNDCEVKIEAGSAKGDNYIGVLYRVTAKHPNDEKLNVIVKLPPQNAARREQFFARPCFLRESEFYETIYPKFRKFQEDKGVDVDKDGFHHVAKCFKSLTDDPYEGLMMEDLKITGFEMFDRFKDSTFEHVQLVMSALGKFHAISFALKDQKPEILAPYKEMVDIFFQRDASSMEQMKIWFDNLKKQSADVLESIGIDELTAKGQEVLKSDFFELLEGCVSGPLAEPHAVLSHGDCWNNNVMYRSENEVPVDIRLLDWQIMRYASPVCDIMYYIFGCTTKALRDKHYNEFLDIYYNSLADFLKRLGSDAETMFPRKVFDDHLKRFGKFGLAMAIMILPIFTSNPEDIPDMDAMAENMQNLQENGTEFDTNLLQFSSEKTIGAYNSRMEGVWLDMYNLGYI